MRKYLKFIFPGLLIIVCALIFLIYSNTSNNGDIKEIEIPKYKIVWNEKTKLKWTDFNYAPNKKGKTIYAEVGLDIRYNSWPPIYYFSLTTFTPAESFVSDTTNMNDLRIAQAKFDLLETYRRKMEKEIDSLEQLKSTDFEDLDFKKIIQHHFHDFENEWESYLPNNIQSIHKIETIINNRLK